MSRKLETHSYTPGQKARRIRTELQANAESIRVALVNIFEGKSWGVKPETIEVDGRAVEIAMHMYPATQRGERDRVIGVVKDGNKFTIEEHISGPNMMRHAHGDYCTEFTIEGNKFTIKPFTMSPEDTFNTHGTITYLDSQLVSFANSGSAYDSLHNDYTHGDLQKMQEREQLFKTPALQKGLDLKLGVTL